MTAIVLKSDGSVAWIADAHEAPAEGGFQVHISDVSGSRLLATGEDIETSSLALAGSTVYWTQAGRPFSASLQ